MVTLPKTDHKTFLVERQFPELARLKRQAILDSLQRGGFAGDTPQDISDDEINDGSEARATLLNEVREYRASLDKLGGEDLQDLYLAELKKKHNEDDLDRFFSKRSAAADFDYWTKMAHWTLEEAVALSLGKSPQVVNKQSLSGIPSWTSPFVREFASTMELAQRATQWGKLFDPVMPVLFVRWAQETEIPLPEELVEKVLRRAGSGTDWKKEYEELCSKHNELMESANQVMDKQKAIIEDLLATNKARHESSFRAETTAHKGEGIPAKAGIRYGNWWLRF